MWTAEEIEAIDREPYCDECGERDVPEALNTIYLATAEWHKVEHRVHPECRDYFVASHLPAVLASLRGVRL